MYELVIDDKTYKVDFVSLSRSATLESKYGTIRTEDGVGHRELTGTYVGYDLQIAFITDTKAYDELWEDLRRPVEFRTVTVPRSYGDFTFQAMINTVGDTSDDLLIGLDGQNFFKGLSVDLEMRRPMTE